MRGDQKVIDYLDRGLRGEPTAANRYPRHHRPLGDQCDLAQTWREEAIEEARHADRSVARIVFLEGFPDLQALDPLRIGQNVQEIVGCDLVAEHDARGLHPDEEGRIDFLETQMEPIRQIGPQLHAQKHFGGLDHDG
jgi:bacterioferritin